MIRSSAPGRIVLATATAAFGLLAVLHAVSATLPALGPPWPATGPWFGFVLGLTLVALGVGLVISGWERRAAAALAAVLLVAACWVQLPALAAAPRAPNPWTGLGELLCLAGGALALAGALRRSGASYSSSGSAVGAEITAGRLLYALPLIIFGVQHFMYARFVATLVPAWMPARLFWAIFVGAAFIAAALSLAAGVQARLAGTLLGAGARYWYDIALGRAGILLSLFANSSGHEVGIRVYLASRVADQALEQLGAQRGEIEREVGSPLEWNPYPQKKDKIIRLVRPGDLADRASWPELTEWLAAKSVAFYKTFARRITGLRLTVPAPTEEALG